MYFLVTLAGVAAMLYLTALLIPKLNIVPLFALGFGCYLWVYVCVTGVLCWADQFTLMRAIGGTALIGMLGADALWLMHRRPRVDFDIRPYGGLLLLVLAGFVLISAKYEYYGMGQDEGVYQTQAINFIYGKTKMQQDFPEYQTLSTDEEREAFSAGISDMLGFYNYDPELPFAYEEKELSEVSGIFHGVPTFPALLALSGKLLGISHMSDIQNVFYFCLLVFVYLTMESLGIKKSLRLALTAVLALSPLVLWTGKSALTEIPQAAMLAGFLWLALGKTREKVFLSILPVAAFCFFHLTIYTIIPGILCVYWILYWFNREKRYLLSAITCTGTFLAGMFLAMCLTGEYCFTYNFKPIYRTFSFVNQYNVHLFFVAYSLALCLVSVILFFRKNPGNISRWNNRISRWTLRGVWVLFLALEFRQVLIKMDTYGGFWKSLQHLSLFGFFTATGVVLLLMVIGICLLQPGKFFAAPQSMAVGVLFGYAILFYCLFLRKNIQYYYYYGRYLVPYLFLIIVFAGILLNSLRLRWSLLVSTLSLLCFLPYESYFLNYQDDTRMTWAVLNDLINVVEPQDTVLVSGDMARYCYYPLRAAAGAKVYPASAHLEEQIASMRKQRTGNVYYIGSGTPDLNWDAVYENTYMASEDNDNEKQTLFLYPKTVQITERRVGVWLLSDRKIYHFSEGSKSVDCTGLGVCEGDFRWMNGAEASVVCSLCPGDYRLTITQGAYVPVELFKDQIYPVSVYLNGKLLERFELTPDNFRQDLTMGVPSEYVEDGMNLLQIRCRPWSPADFGMEDERILGIALKDLVFTAAK